MVTSWRRETQQGWDLRNGNAGYDLSHKFGFWGCTSLRITRLVKELRRRSVKQKDRFYLSTFQSHTNLMYILSDSNQATIRSTGTKVMAPYKRDTCLKRVRGSWCAAMAELFYRKVGHKPCLGGALSTAKLPFGCFEISVSFASYGDSSRMSAVNWLTLNNKHGGKISGGNPVTTSIIKIIHIYIDKWYLEND